MAPIANAPHNTTFFNFCCLLFFWVPAPNHDASEILDLACNSRAELTARHLEVSCYVGGNGMIVYPRLWEYSKVVGVFIEKELWKLWCRNVASVYQKVVSGATLALWYDNVDVLGMPGLVIVTCKKYNGVDPNKALLLAAIVLSNWDRLPVCNG
ncbi:hypothetical protein L208DRAFT_1379571 [Tricholoma matsutake]|nr:hypothetical protein L208DRAFT_1379571 [Tricholoma matsutake 945]